MYFEVPNVDEITLTCYDSLMYMTIAFIAAILITLALWFGIGKPSLKRGIFVTFFMAVPVVLILLSLATITVGTKIGQDSALTFKEYWNGYETAAVYSAVECTRDGSCRHTYACDPYITVETEYYTDSDGNTQTRTVTKTHWHECPISTEETTYVVKTTLDNFTVAGSLMTGDEWRAGMAIPGGKQTAPQLWLDAKARVDANLPGAVTKRHDYKNYIQASDVTVFKKYEGSIDSYIEQGLLPAPAKADGPYGVVKAYNMGGAVDPSTFSDYVIDVTSINGLFGDQLYGDLHVIFVPSNVNADEYKNSLAAYWSSTKLLGKDTASKNTFVTVFGVKGDTVEWARAFTGMPIGNEALIQDVLSLKGDKVDASLIGRPHADLNTGKRVSGNGALEGLLWGSHAFERVSMSGDGDATGGFSYLRGDIQVSTTTYVWSSIVNFFVWALALGLIIALVLPMLMDYAGGSSDDQSERYSPRTPMRGYGNNGKNRW